MIGVADVGGTKIRYALYQNGELFKVSTIPTPKNGPIWEALRDAFNSLDVSIISIATMGPLLLSKGMIISNPHSSIKNQELAVPLMRETGKPVIVLNDAVAGAYAEAGARDVENLVYVAFGTGVGVGAVVDGRLLLGREGNAHEAGHMVLGMGRGLECGCGKRDHAEAFLGGSKIHAFLRKEGFDVNNAKEAFELIRSNTKAFKAFEEALNSFVASLVAVYDPEVVVFGGGVFFKNADVFEKALTNLKKYLLWEPPSLERALYDELSPLYGAGRIAEERPAWLIRKLAYVTELHFKEYEPGRRN